MSISAQQPMNEESQEMMRELYGEPVDSDDHLALYNDLPPGRQRLANLQKVAKQDLKIDYYREGEIKTFADGTQYRVCATGWEKVPATVQNEINEAHAFLDKNILSFEDVLLHVELADLVKWADETLNNGAALCIIVEKGNYGDNCVEHCENYITSGEWVKDCVKHKWLYTDEDTTKMLRILELLKPLTEEQREMICERKTITEQLFDLLYNQASSGG